MTTAAATAPSAPTKKYRLIGTNVMVNRVMRRRGEVVELTAAQVKRIGKNLVDERGDKSPWPLKKRKPAAVARLTNNLLPPREPFDKEDAFEDDTDTEDDGES